MPCVMFLIHVCAANRNLRSNIKSMTRPIRVILVDDHQTVRDGVRAYFETLPDFEVVGEAFSGKDVLNIVPELVPDIALVELIEEDVDIIRNLRQVSPRTQVVVLTSCFEDKYVFPAFEAGAVSYNLKNVKMKWLADELRRVHRGELEIHPRVAVTILEKICNEKNAGQSSFLELTAQELEILRFIADGLTNSRVAGKLLISETMVKNHVVNILSKLHIANLLQKERERRGMQEE